MTASKRSAQLAQVHKVLKRHYKPIVADPERPVLEHLLFACCLQEARYDVAEDAFATLVEEFYDWNEIRVSSIRELSEVLSALPDARSASFRVKRVLQHLFESTYSFDLENFRKKNLGPATERLKKMDGSTDFAVSYVVQSALGGHAIPIDGGARRVLHILDLISDKDLKTKQVPGLERAVAKSKGIEFGSLLHQFGAKLLDNLYSPETHAILLEINPKAKPRLPKRRRRKTRRAGDKAAAKGKKKEKAPSKQDISATKSSKAPGARVTKKAGSGGKKAADAARQTKHKSAGEAERQQAAKKKSTTAKKRQSSPSKSEHASESTSKQRSSAGLPKRKPR